MYTCITCRCGLLLLVLRTTTMHMHMHACRLVGGCWHCQLNSCERSVGRLQQHWRRLVIHLDPSFHRPADRPESQAAQAQHYLLSSRRPRPLLQPATQAARGTPSLSSDREHASRVLVWISRCRRPVTGHPWRHGADGYWLLLLRSHVRMKRRSNSARTTLPSPTRAACRD